MIVLLEDRAGFQARHVNLIDRILAWLRAPGLDRRLAEGAPPESSLDLAIEAERLTRPAERRVLAGSLERIVAGAGRSKPDRGGVPVARAAVRSARPELESVAARLQSPGPVNVRGVARVRLLLSDGMGPLYRAGDMGSAGSPAGADLLPGAGGIPGRVADLRAELRAAMAAMDPLG